MTNFKHDSEELADLIKPITPFMSLLQNPIGDGEKAHSPLGVSFRVWHTKDARNHFSDLMHEAREGTWQLVAMAGRKEPVVCISMEQLAEVLHLVARPQTGADLLPPPGLLPSLDEPLELSKGTPGSHIIEL